MGMAPTAYQVVLHDLVDGTPIKYPIKVGLTNDAEASELNDRENGSEKAFAGACRVIVGRNRLPGGEK